jgi:hypothetical protein
MENEWEGTGRSLFEITVSGLARWERETPRKTTLRIDSAQPKFEAGSFRISFNIVMSLQLLITIYSGAITNSKLQPMWRYRYFTQCAVHYECTESSVCCPKPVLWYQLPAVDVHLFRFPNYPRTTTTAIPVSHFSLHLLELLRLAPICTVLSSPNNLLLLSY